MKTKPMLLVVTLCIACTVVAQQKAPADGKGGDVQSHINALEDELLQAVLKGGATHVAVAEKYLAPDYVGIQGGFNARMVSREEALQDIKSGAVKHETIDLSNRKIRVYGNTVIVNADWAMKGTYNGHEFRHKFRVVRIWVKQGKDWKVVSSQSTEIRAAGSEAK